LKVEGWRVLQSYNPTLLQSLSSIAKHNTFVLSKKETLSGMKRISLLLVFCVVLLSIAHAQVPPNAFNYSAVARNAAGDPIAASTIGIQITILKTSPTGASQYMENHFVNTDAFGLFNLVIGAGAVQSGNMATIDWSNDTYYLKVGMDANGGSSFVTMGTTQLLSVPYALYAKSAGSVNGNTGGGSFTHYIGEEFGGGVIFHLWKDAAGAEHGLIVDKVDLSNAQEWSNVYVSIGPSAQSTWNGLSNSNAIVGQAGHTSSAAALCLNSTNGGYTDWYLPAIDELSLLSQSKFNINKSLSSIAGATVLINYYGYWSSSEIGNYAGELYIFDGTLFDMDKNLLSSVRAVRAF
jgi:hypothetical protein